MSAYEAVKEWVFSGGDDVAPLTFEQGLTDRQLAKKLIEDWPTWSEGKCPYSLTDMTAAFGDVREEFAET